MESEHQLIQDLIKDVDGAIDALYKEHAPRVYNTALSYSKSVEEAEEITQDVFLKIYRNAASFKGNASLTTWIYRITVNTALNYLKKRKRLTIFNHDYEGSEIVDFHHPGVQLENKENAKALFDALATLPDNQKTAFILSLIEDRPRQDVADIMQTSLKAVESLLQRAKKNMRSKLIKRYPNRRK